MSTLDIVDYRGFRLSKINNKEYSHLKLLFFWPIYGAMFLFVERYYQVESYFPMYCAWDDKIPFCEYFVIPYLFWFVFLIGGLLYALLFNVEGFRKLMKFIIVTYSVTIIIYLIFPTCQELRPAAFERDNIFTKFLEEFYQFDTNTNVCPSIHVIGTIAVAIMFWRDKRFKKTGWRLINIGLSLMICISTVFLKQHSILDVGAAVLVSLIGYGICYWEKAGTVKISSEEKTM